ncbi:MAG: aldehyde dehydrogenase family protein [Acidimicrobiia bacterium]|nr:aldehyde dehydrogenase family protein [Acidimicrobiia bacterium]
MTERSQIIGSERVAGEGVPIPNWNPSDATVLAEVDSASPGQVDAAVRAAVAAGEGEWGRMDPFTRRRLMHVYAATVHDHAAELGTLHTNETGFPNGFAFGEAAAAADYIDHFAGWADKLRGAVVPTPVTGLHTYTKREPVGVVAAIVAFNVPLMLTAFKLAPALAAGCTVVLKASEQAPFGPRRMTELALEAGLPPGVVNFVTGGSEVGSALVEHPDVRLVSFTGGSGAGSAIAAAAGARFKRTLLELGGKSANIVFADCDLERAATGAGQAVFLLTGQQCIAGSRVLVQREIFDDFVARFAEVSSEWTPGDPFAHDTRMGPLISEAALARVTTMVEEAQERGAKVVTGGGRPSGSIPPGWFFEPTILTNIGPADPVCTEEIFGPVAVVTPFDTEEEAVALANGTRYGLAGGVWTRDLARAHRIADAVHTGTMWVNSWSYVTAGAPFGGMGSSGVGREGGSEALDAFTEVKTVYVPTV